MKTKDVKTFLKSSVKALTDGDDATTYRFPLDGDLAIYVGWGEGFDPSAEGFLHSKSEPQYCVCVKIAENSYPFLWDDAYMPWYTDDNEVYDTDASISPDEDYERTAEWLLAEYKTIRELLDEGALTF